MPKLVIVGGGFGGLAAAKSLAKSGGFEITLIDRRNHHLFQPLLYQVATAGLSPADIAAPIRGLLSEYQSIRVLMDEVVSVELSTKRLHLKGGASSGSSVLDYDYLVLACGAQHSYFGHSEWESKAPGLKTLEQATEIRRRLLLAFEEAEKEPDPEKQKQLLTFVIVGGGPTGVELAGAIAEISRTTLSRDFRKIDPSRTRVLLIEAGSRVLASFDAQLSQRAARDLEILGVQIWTSTRVTEVFAEGVRLGAEEVRTRTVIWAAGVEAAAVGATLGTPLDQMKRVMVEPDLSVPGYPEVFVIGDQAHCLAENGKPLPGLAPVAMQQGRHVAQNIRLTLGSQARQPFVYRDKGQMATIGRKKAVMQFGSLRLGGFFAWVGWLLVHIYYLIGFKNRLFVLMQWTWSYLTHRRGARLIVDKEWQTYSATGVTLKSTVSENKRTAELGR